MAKIQGVHIPAEMKNLAINGSLDFWQSQEAATTTINTASTQSPLWTADMFKARSFGTTVKNYSFKQSTNVPTQVQSGYQSLFSYQFQVLTAIAAGVANDEVIPIEYVIEGYDYQKIHSKTVTFGFWFNASVAGIYSVALGNAAGNRSYVTTVTQISGGAWEFKTVTVPLDTTGTWNFDNTVGLEVYIGSFLGSGASGITSTLNAWQAGSFIAASTAVNYFATVNATISIAQFSIVEGPLGFGAKGFVRCGKDYQAELAMCQRYYEKSFDQGVQPGTASAPGCAELVGVSAIVSSFMSVPFKVNKRATAPTCNVYSISGAVNNWRDTTAAADVGATVDTTQGMSQFTGESNGAAVVGHIYKFQWTADSRI